MRASGERRADSSQPVAHFCVRTHACTFEERRFHSLSLAGGELNEGVCADHLGRLQDWAGQRVGSQLALGSFA